MRRVILRLGVILVLTGAGVAAWQYASPSRDAAETGAESVGGVLARIAAVLGIGGDPRAGLYGGYVEAEYVYVTSQIGGTLLGLAVERGQEVAANVHLFQLDDAAERAARDEATERLHQADAQLANLLTGRRQPEIDALLAQRAQVEASLQQTEAELARQAQLRARGIATGQAYEIARMQRDRDRARIEELTAQLRVARMPAREDEIRAAQAAVLAARAALAQAEWRLAQKTGEAPAAGLVVDTLYRPGEMVQAGTPVVQLLPPENIKIRFFVPQAQVAQIAVGQRVRIACDGCTPVTATVRYISPRAEFTPPVIYSREQRARMVFMVEARPDEHPGQLRVGQPVDVALVRP
jgi:HlyD family secretion protein